MLVGLDAGVEARGRRRRLEAVLEVPDGDAAAAPGSGCAVPAKPVQNAASRRSRSPSSIERGACAAAGASADVSGYALWPTVSKIGSVRPLALYALPSASYQCAGLRVRRARRDHVRAGLRGVQRVPARREQRLVRGGRALLRLPERRGVRLRPDRDVADPRVAPQDVRDEAAVRRARARRRAAAASPGR